MQIELTKNAYLFIYLFKIVFFKWVTLVCSFQVIFSRFSLFMERNNLVGFLISAALPLSQLAVRLPLNPFLFFIYLLFFIYMMLSLIGISSCGVATYDRL